MKKIIFVLFLLCMMFSNLFADNNYKSLELNEVTGYNVGLRSAIYPGLGQIYLGEKNKGYFFLSLTSLSIIGAVYSWNSAEQNYNDYLERGGKNDSRYDDYRDDLTQMHIFMAVGVITWMYSIYDAYKMGNDVRYSKNFEKKTISMFVENKSLYIMYNKKL